MDTVGFEDCVNFFEGETELFVSVIVEHGVSAAVLTYRFREQEISRDKLQAVVDNVDDPDLVTELVDAD